MSAPVVTREPEEGLECEYEGVDAGFKPAIGLGEARVKLRGQSNVIGTGTSLQLLALN